jgi:hypothetical protein
MSRDDIQYWLNGLYTQAPLRQEFFDDRTGFYEKNGLRGLLRETLDQLVEKEIRFFAQSLVRKRLLAVRQLLPGTYILLKENFDTHFETYANNHLPKGIHKHQEDAVAFAHYILQLTVIKDHASCLFDLIRFEQQIIHGFLNPSRRTCLFFQYPVREISMQLRSGGVWPSTNPKRTFTWWKGNVLRMYVSVF